MKKYATFLLIAIIACSQASSQNSAAANTTSMQNGWYFEAAGQSILGLTFNYERYFSKQPGGLSIHAGFGGGYLPFFFDEDNSKFFGAVPAGLSYNIPISENNQHFIEVGVGYSLLFGGDGGGGSIGSVIAGWRYQSRSGKLQIRATLLPVITELGANGGGHLTWVGFSIGRRF